MRPLWKHFLDDITFVLFLIDLNDEDRLAEAAEELALFYKMVKNKEHNNSHFFTIFTKQDLLPKPNREQALANATSRIKTLLHPHLVDTLPLHFLPTPNLNLRSANQ
jgi:GTP-binding protein EngB required for normal cell division